MRGIVMREIPKDKIFDLVLKEGKIGAILSSKPHERRLLIEEAAGITKFRARRREAELKRLQDTFLTAVEDGEAQIVTIVADAGLGKSRLLYEFFSRTELEEQVGTAIRPALARYADEVYDALNEAQQEGARQVFLQLIRPGQGTEDSRRVATRAEIGEQNWPLTQHLADRRLVVTGLDSTSVQTVEVIHEALIGGWARLQA